MKIAVFGRTELRCSICVLLLVPAAAVLGKLPALMLALVSLAVHELSHAFMAARLGLVVSSIEVQPFGFIAELHTPPRTPSECLSVAAAGPFASLLIALCGARFWQIHRAYIGSLPRFLFFQFIARINESSPFSAS